MCLWHSSCAGSVRANVLTGEPAAERTVCQRHVPAHVLRARHAQILGRLRRVPVADLSRSGASARQVRAVVVAARLEASNAPASCAPGRQRGATLPPCGPGSSHRPRARSQPMQWRALRNTTKPPQGAASHGATYALAQRRPQSAASPSPGDDPCSLLLHPLPFSPSCSRPLLVTITSQCPLRRSLLTLPLRRPPLSQPSRAPSVHTTLGSHAGFPTVFPADHSQFCCITR